MTPSEMVNSSKKDMKLVYVLIFVIFNLAYIIGFDELIRIAGGPISSDPRLHLSIVEAYIAGENPLTNEEYFGNPFPYPPAFHLTVAALSKVLFTSPGAIFNLLQILLFSMILASTLFLVSEIKNSYIGILTVCLLVSGFAFWDRSSQPIPNGFDALFFPLIVYAYMKGHRKALIALGTFLVYNHLVYAIVLLSSLVAHAAAYNKGKIKDFGIVGILCLPLFLLYVPYIENLTGFATGQETMVREYQRAIGHPFYNVAYLGYFFSLIAFFSILHFATKKLSDFERVVGLWAAVLVPMYILFPHRALPYLAQPLAIMGAITLDDYAKTENQKNIILAVLFVIACLYIIAEYNIMQITTSPAVYRIALLLGDFESHEAGISNLF